MTEVIHLADYRPQATRRRLTDSERAAILSSKARVCDLAERYGVTTSAICHVRSRNEHQTQEPAPKRELPCRHYKVDWDATT